MKCGCLDPPEMANRPAKSSVFLLAVIDASRAERNLKEDRILLQSPFGTINLEPLAGFSPVGLNISHVIGSEAPNDSHQSGIGSKKPPIVQPCCVDSGGED
jgi:hypothetical protein